MEETKENKINIITDTDNKSGAENESVKEDNYDFLDPNKKSENSDDIITNQFDTAFKNSSPVIQNYILSDKLEENIKLICKIEKLDEDKAKVIIENITVSILVGLLPIDVAKETMIESFRSSGILLEPFSAGMIMKNIDAYILSDIRKQVLESKIKDKKEIRHLTLKEKKEEAEKEELRKILLERTGNITGKGTPIIQYKKREIPEPSNGTKISAETRKGEFTRDSLLAKINLQNVSDESKIKDRFVEIKKQEDERLEDMKKDEEKEKEEDTSLNKNLTQEEKIEDGKVNAEENDRDEEIDISKEFANALKNKLISHEDEKTDLNSLREERGEEEEELQKSRDTAYSRALAKENTGESSQEEQKTPDGTFDPYRETI